MTRHDEAVLWDYAAGELDRGDAKVLEAHLEDCPECRERLASVHVARQALDLAREASPIVSWQPLDEKIGALVEKRLASKARRPMLWRFGGGVLVAACAAALIAFLTSTPDVAPPPPEPLAELTPPGTRVDKAQGLTRVGAGDATPIDDGTELKSGDVLRTSLAGKAFVHLPDSSHVRVGGGTQLALTRSEEDDVALTLERGRVAVAASHRQRKGFVVHSGGVTVHVVGTVFGVSNDGDELEVAVSSGRVRVELAAGDSVLVDAGQRVRLDAKTGKPQRTKLTPAFTRELDEVTAVAEATTAVENRAVVAATGGARPSAPPMVTAQGAPRTLPRLDPKEAKARQVQLPPEVQLSPDELAPMPKKAEEEPVVVARRLEPATEVEVEAPGNSWPSLAGGSSRGVPPQRDVAQSLAPQAEAPRATPGPDEAAEWEALPKPQPAHKNDAAEWAALPQQQQEPEAPKARLKDEPEPVVRAQPLAKDLETIFMQRAEASLEKGGCDRFLVGLEDIAQDDTRDSRTELARVLRARCFDVSLRPRQALNEYRKYLEEYPRGRYAGEARQALGE